MTNEEWMGHAMAKADRYANVAAALAGGSECITQASVEDCRAKLSAHLQQRPLTGTDLHAVIMNLPCNAEARLQQHNPAELFAYRLGHRDARHAAAELVGRPLTGREATDGERWTMDRAADFLEHYAAYIRREVKCADIEGHPYLPELDYVAGQVRDWFTSDSTRDVMVNGLTKEETSATASVAGLVNPPSPSLPVREEPTTPDASEIKRVLGYLRTDEAQIRAAKVNAAWADTMARASDLILNLATSPSPDKEGAAGKDGVGACLCRDGGCARYMAGGPRCPMNTCATGVKACDPIPPNESAVKLPLYQAAQWNTAVASAEREPHKLVALDGRTVLAVHEALARGVALPLGGQAGMRAGMSDHDRYESSPQWPWALAILLILLYGLWSSA